MGPAFAGTTCLAADSIFQQSDKFKCASAISRRVAPEVCFDSRPLESEGAGNAGRPMRPIAACAMVEVERTRVSQVTPESPGIPRAMVYGLFRALPGDRAFLPPSPAKVAFRELDASVGASGPHVFAVRLSAVRQERIRVHRIPPRVRDDRDTPLEWGGTANHIVLIWGSGKQKYFCLGGWTAKSPTSPVICPSGKIG